MSRHAPQVAHMPPITHVCIVLCLIFGLVHYSAAILPRIKPAKIQSETRSYHELLHKHNITHRDGSVKTLVGIFFDFFNASSSTASTAFSNNNNNTQALEEQNEVSLEMDSMLASAIQLIAEAIKTPTYIEHNKTFAHRRRRSHVIKPASN